MEEVRKKRAGAKGTEKRGLQFGNLVAPREGEDVEMMVNNRPTCYAGGIDSGNPIIVADRANRRETAKGSKRIKGFQQPASPGERCGGGRSHLQRRLVLSCKTQRETRSAGGCAGDVPAGLGAARVSIVIWFRPRRNRFVRRLKGRCRGNGRGSHLLFFFHRRTSV